MKRCVFTGLLITVIANYTFSQDQKIKAKLQEFFFDLPFNSGIETIKQRLNSNPEFKLYEDPNRDPAKSITGTLVKNINLNPGAIHNQLIIVFSDENRKLKKVSFKWSIDYKSEDLPQALFDYEKLKSDFTPYFNNIEEKEGTGYHQEETHSIILEKDPMKVTIRILKYINSGHTISIEFDDVWKIK